MSKTRSKGIVWAHAAGVLVLKSIPLILLSVKSHDVVPPPRHVPRMTAESGRRMWLLVTGSGCRVWLLKVLWEREEARLSAFVHVASCACLIIYERVWCQVIMCEFHSIQSRVYVTFVVYPTLDFVVKCKLCVRRSYVVSRVKRNSEYCTRYYILLYMYKGARLHPQLHTRCTSGSLALQTGRIFQSLL